VLHLLPQHLGRVSAPQRLPELGTRLGRKPLHVSKVVLHGLVPSHQHLGPEPPQQRGLGLELAAFWEVHDQRRHAHRQGQLHRLVEVEEVRRGPGELVDRDEEEVHRPLQVVGVDRVLAPREEKHLHDLALR
jgi:hypothetical protein